LGTGFFFSLRTALGHGEKMCGHWGVLCKIGGTLHLLRVLFPLDATTGRAEERKKLPRVAGKASVADALPGAFLDKAGESFGPPLI
jgi:hypothetical protein